MGAVPTPPTPQTTSLRFRRNLRKRGRGRTANTMKTTAQSLLAKLASTRTLSDANDIVAQLQKVHDFRWRAVGDREGNFGTINIGSDPGNAFIERVTNAIDGVIEREAARRLAKLAKSKTVKGIPASPREAVEEWFGVPGGRVANLKDLPSGKKSRQEMADDVVIKLLDGSSKKSPTVEVRDRGIGLTASQMPNTILGLNDTNKIDKPYLAGAYGQGGSTALAFSPGGCLLVSRRHPDLLPEGESDRVAVAFARYNELDPERNKNGRYEYLVGPDNKIAQLDVKEASGFEPGTCVVHFNLEIPQYSARMTQLTNSFWWLLQNALFDPVLPFWVEERRSAMLGAGKSPDRRTIAGNYTRLMDDGKSKVEHTNTVDVALAHSGGQTFVKVNYWVIKANPEEPGGTPTASYVDAFKPITYTLNGQTHDKDDRRLIADRLSLPYLAKSLIIQVELDHLHPQARRALLSSTRDRLKQLGLIEDMREAICAALSEDEELIRLDRLRKEQLLDKHSDAERKKMRERFARLMEKFKAGTDASAKGKGSDKGGRRDPGPRGPSQPLAPLPTKSEPTFIQIANVSKPIPIRIDRHALLRLESDAPDGYLSSHVHAKLTIACEPEGLLELESRSDFRGGRARITVKPLEKTKAGDTGTLTVYLFTPKDKQLTAKVKFLVEKPEPEEASGTGGKSKVQVPDPVAVTKAEWKNHGWNESSVTRVAEDASGTTIYVNIDNRHLVALLNSSTYQEVGIKRMRTNFLLYVAFYSWVQHETEKHSPSSLDGKEFEEYEAREFDRLAQTVVYSISAASRMEEDE